MRVAVVDGQGGGIGRALVERLREELGPQQDILALGTNPLATSLMLRAGASEGASGENAIVVNAPKVDVIVGTIGILAADSMLGELTPAMARAVAASPARKVLVPLNRCGIEVVGAQPDSLPHAVAEAAFRVKTLFASAGGAACAGPAGFPLQGKENLV